MQVTRPTRTTASSSTLSSKLGHSSTASMRAHPSSVVVLLMFPALASLGRHVRPGGGFEPASAITVFEKGDVNGENASPLFKWLKSEIMIPKGDKTDSKVRHVAAAGHARLTCPSDLPVSLPCPDSSPRLDNACRRTAAPTSTRFSCRARSLVAPPSRCGRLSRALTSRGTSRSSSSTRMASWCRGAISHSHPQFRCLLRQHLPVGACGGVARANGAIRSTLLLQVPQVLPGRRHRG